MRIVLLGPPAAGKGSLAAVLKKQWGIVHISTGDILREEIKNDTELGKEAKKYIDHGELVSDSLVIELIEKKIQNKAAIERGYLLDGFPRTLTQAKELDKILAAHEMPLNYAAYLDAPLDLIVWRLSGRRVCRNCGAVYHKTNRPPKVEDTCDVCGKKELYQRADDNEQTLRNRMGIYFKSTVPIVNYYESKGILRRLDGAKDPEELQQEINKNFNEDTGLNKS